MQRVSVQAEAGQRMQAADLLRLNVRNVHGDMVPLSAFASAVLAGVPDIAGFKSGRDFAAWLGLVPRQNSSGGKERLGRITKMGDRTIRRLLVIGAMATIRWSRSKEGFAESWLGKIIARKPIKLAAVALANKTARIIWAIMTRQETYRMA